ncbi:MAG TPA: hypothetical protein PK079_25730 [Leptospiraceae bacterium]|nr:hypothetical protein [Leptospiraceae bacterium]HMW05576.1 hypothetical protein [Leptospiraceae bacterium]HMX34222.1 hypothetical protein [Leptospiraceae bacterium]HMY31086.1 hypothetical protein [Leptospiraceae bacterium]HMZ65286.1 hypothetical protein [Leptospiraceae bacterium]
MWNRIKVLMLFLFTLSILSEDILDIDNPTITWSASEGSTEYILQIKNEVDEITYEIETKETYYKVDLEPGRYSHRVGTYNKFGKVTSYTDWVPFIVVRSLPPIVTSEQFFISSKSEKEKTILIEGKNLYKDTKVFLKNENSTVQLKNKVFKKGTIEITIDNENMKEGSYDLILENPRKKILTLNQFYQLGETKSLPNSSRENPYPYWKEAGKSMLIPGWGQYSKEHFPSSIFFNLCFIIAGANYSYSYQTFHSDKKKYNNTINQGILYQMIDKQDSVLLYNYFNSNEYFKRGEDSANKVYTASILFASIYTLNILDALLWKTSISLTKQEATLNLYTKVYSNPTNLNITNQNSYIEFGFRFVF